MTTAAGTGPQAQAAPERPAAPGAIRPGLLNGVVAMNVFISHAAADKDLARRVADVLKASGFQVWWDESQVLPGDNWGEKLGQALDTSDAMVVLLTRDSLQSPNVSYEIGYALGKKDYKGRVVPVIAAPPDQLPRDKIPWVLSKFPTVNLGEGGAEEGLRRIAQVLQEAA
jgi:hypothetical protein